MSHQVNIGGAVLYQIMSNGVMLALRTLLLEGVDIAGEDNRKTGLYGFKSSLGVRQSLKFWIPHQTASPLEQKRRLS